MVKAVLTPDKDKLEVGIPKQYVGRKVEILIYPVDEIIEEDKPVTMSQFKGSISEEFAEKALEHVKQSREEWQTDI